MSANRSRDRNPSFAELSVSADEPRPAARHGDLQSLAEDLYLVRGRMPSTPMRPLFERLFMHYSRTMTIVRQRSPEGRFELTLLNTLRLDDRRLAQLDRLGRVRHVVRLGSFHGIDDAFYVQHYDADYWVVEGMRSAAGLKATPRLLSESGDEGAPTPGGRTFVFRDVRYPEAIYVLPATPERPGVAVTTDSIQNHPSVWDVDNSLLVSFAIWRIGLAGEASLGPIWMEQQAPRPPKGAGRPDPATRKQEIARFFRPQLERLLADYDFDVLISGHGPAIESGAKAAVRARMDAQIPAEPAG
jgi:hypothetical protein